eukprot:scaffold112796_cov62-Attheya_sp.AAC.5
MAQSWYLMLCTQPCKTLSTLLPIPPPCPVIPIPTPKSFRFCCMHDLQEALPPLELERQFNKSVKGISYYNF